MTIPDNVIPFPGGGRGLDKNDMQALANDLIDQTGGPHEALAALMGVFGVPPDADSFAGRRPVLLPRRDEKLGYVVRVDLDGAKPPIWRRLRLVSDLTLAQLHGILQVAMGWTDSHLHHFLMGPKTRDWRVEPFLSSYDVMEGEPGIPETDVRLDEVIAVTGDRLFYEYDFGDSWHHTIKLEKVVPWSNGDPEAVCLDGRRRCPPEDVGGIGGYHELLEALAGHVDPDQAEWMAERLAWLPDDFDPAAFSVAETNELLVTGPLPDLANWHPAVGNLIDRAGGSVLSPIAAVITRATAGPWHLDDAQVESAVHRYRYLLATIGSGIKLTAAGYLPPRIVETLYRDLGMDDGWWGKGNREDQTYPVMALRESATAIGLLRKSRGQLLPTKIGQQLIDDPRGMLGHIASRLPLGRAHEKDAGLLALLSTAAGIVGDVARAEAAEAMADIGWRVLDDNTEWATYRWARPTMEVFDNLVGEHDPLDHRSLVARALLHRP